MLDYALKQQLELGLTGFEGDVAGKGGEQERFGVNLAGILC